MRALAAREPFALCALTALAALLSIIFILDYTNYPQAQPRLFIFQYLLREQDLAGSALIIAIAVGAYLPQSRSAVLDLIDALSRHPWRVAGASFAVLCTAMLTVAHNHPLAGDEHLAVFQSRVFAAGHLAGQFPRELLGLLIPPHYEGRWLIASQASGAVASIYWPGFALLLAPFSLIGAPWACNPLLASLSVVLMAKLAARLTGNAQAGGWAMLFALGSPAFTGMALSYFSMSAHLFLNLLFAWLVLKGGPRALAAAGVVGSFALVQSNPVPHMLFALPWIIWIARRPGSRRELLALTAGYAPLALLLGLGWWLFLRQLQGPLFVLPYPSSDGDALHRAANLLWYLHLELRAAFSIYDEGTMLRRLSEQVRLWSWAVPGLPLLALAGWWLQRGVTGLRLLGWSFLATLLGYLFVSFDQGYGWGARYLHPAWCALPILASSAMVSARADAAGERLASYVARMALLSLVFATALRFFQIDLFVDEQLSLRPPYENGVRQLVFITPDFEYYLQDFVQNDPFLREPVIFMTSHGLRRDYTDVIQRRFPGARLTYVGANGSVWRLDGRRSD